jgi:RNA polymerase-binding protein DksA
VDQANIDEFRRRLDGERTELVTQLVDMGVDPATGQPSDVQFDQSFADSGQATDEKTRVLSMAEGLIETLHEVDAALERIETGKYGNCESCGQPIPGERLEARPYARLCMACMKKRAS